MQHQQTLTKTQQKCKIQQMLRKNGNSTNESSGNSEQLETYTHTMKGDNGVIVTNQYLVREFREISDNFDQQIILDLNNLFMALW